MTGEVKKAYEWALNQNYQSKVIGSAPTAGRRWTAKRRAYENHFKAMPVLWKIAEDEVKRIKDGR